MNFKTECTMDTEEIKHYLNRYLPMDIAITEVDEVPERFHAQLGVISQTYVYRIPSTDVPSVLRPQAYLPCFKVPDKKAMQQAAMLLIGTHDFRNFAASKSDKSQSGRSRTSISTETMRKCRS